MARQTKRAAAVRAQKRHQLAGRPRRNKKKRRLRLRRRFARMVPKVDDLGELQSVPGADWNKEIGAISQINYQRRKISRCYSTISRVIPKAIVCSLHPSAARGAWPWHFDSHRSRQKGVDRSVQRKTAPMEKGLKEVTPPAQSTRGRYSRKFTKVETSTS